MGEKYTAEHAGSGLTDALPGIECWENQFPNYEITIEIPEFTAVCPKTGLPDFGSIVITYVPDKYCLELKSLKLYLLAYRDLGIFNENVVNRILKDVVEACSPIRASVTGRFTPRGGMSNSVVVRYNSPAGDELT